MKTVSPDVPSPRVILFGLQCAFTGAVADVLSARQLVPSALLMPGHPELDQPQRAELSVTTLPIAGGAARLPARSFPTFRIGPLTAATTLEFVDSLEPDVIIVACFPSLIPRAIRNMPRLIAINIHPSLLPAHRGPDPLFWIMRDGGVGCGVTVHELSGKLDAGDILAQRVVMYPDGARESAVERQLATSGAELAADVVRSVETGHLHRREQDERAATYEPWPGIENFTISTVRSVRHAWNFIRGVAGRGVPVRVESDSDVFFISDALAIGEGTNPPQTTIEGQVPIQFKDGWLLAQIQHQSN